REGRPGDWRERVGRELLRMTSYTVESHISNSLCCPWQRPGLNDYIVGTGYRIRGAGSLAKLCIGNCKYMQAVCFLAYGVKVIVIIPEHHGDGIGGKHWSVTGDRVRAVHVEDLQTFLAGDGDQVSGRRHFQIGWINNSRRRHVCVGARGGELSL